MPARKQLRRGDFVQYDHADYLVSSVNREGFVRLLPRQEGAARVPGLIAPARVKLISALPSPRSNNYHRTAPERIEALAAMLREVRASLGLTTRRLADAMNYSQPQISKAESGKANSLPSARYLERFAEVTGAEEDLLCATAGIVPRAIAEALTDLDTLRAVRSLIHKIASRP